MECRSENPSYSTSGRLAYIYIYEQRADIVYIYTSTRRRRGNRRSISLRCPRSLCIDPVTEFAGACAIYLYVLWLFSFRVKINYPRADGPRRGTQMTGDKWRVAAADRLSFYRMLFFFFRSFIKRRDRNTGPRILNGLEHMPDDILCRLGISGWLKKIVQFRNWNA